VPASELFLLLTIAQIALSMAIAPPEERFCTEKYGEVRPTVSTLTELQDGQEYQNQGRARLLMQANHVTYTDFCYRFVECLVINGSPCINSRDIGISQKGAI
jgi:hypothetical protein